jgi:hypothetical protein
MNSAVSLLRRGFLLCILLVTVLPAQSQVLRLNSGVGFPLQDDRRLSIFIPKLPPRHPAEGVRYAGVERR